jgi:hypothetical protein
VTVNGKIISKDTEPDLVLAPACYWELFLQSRFDKLLRKKLPQNRSVRSDETNVVVSVTERSERDLTKRSDETEIEWTRVVRQLIVWGQYFQKGKKLRVDLSFSYVKAGPLPFHNSMKSWVKKGPVSTTQRMLAERELQLNAEEESSGQSSIWQEVYSLMRCPGPPSNLGSYCWINPEGKKLYKLKTHHFRDLIKHVEKGRTLQTHDDVPNDIRQQLYNEEQQRRDRKSGKQRYLLPAYLRSISTCCLDPLVRHPYQLHRLEPKLQCGHHMRPQMCL